MVGAIIIPFHQEGLEPGKPTQLVRGRAGMQPGAVCLPSALGLTTVSAYQFLALATDDQQNQGCAVSDIGGHIMQSHKQKAQNRMGL